MHAAPVRPFCKPRGRGRLSSLNSVSCVSNTPASQLQDRAQSRTGVRGAMGRKTAALKVQSGSAGWNYDCKAIRQAGCHAKTGPLSTWGGVGYLVHASRPDVGGAGRGGRGLHHPHHPGIAGAARTTCACWGFAEGAERDWFRLLTAVQGAGSKVALAILSALSTGELRDARGRVDAAMVARGQWRRAEAGGPDRERVEGQGGHDAGRRAGRQWRFRRRPGRASRPRQRRCGERARQPRLSGPPSPRRPSPAHRPNWAKARARAT